MRFNIFAVSGCCMILVYCTQLSQQQRTAKSNAQCGSLADIAGRVEVCSRPVMDIIEGTLTVWPRNDTDIEALCGKIHGGERCIREEGRRCTQGLHRTIVSTFANSIQNSRKKECVRSKYNELLKTINCIELHTGDTRKLVASVVSRLSVIEHQMKDLDQKTNAICCIIRSMETEMRAIFDRICPAQTEVMIRLYKAVIDDVYNLICRTAKCQQDPLRQYKIPKSVNASQGKLVATILKIIFSLDG